MRKNECISLYLIHKNSCVEGIFKQKYDNIIYCELLLRAITHLSHAFFKNNSNIAFFMNPSDNISFSESNSQFRGPKLLNLSENINMLNKNFFSLGQAENNSVAVEFSVNKTDRNNSIFKVKARKGFFF